MPLMAVQVSRRARPADDAAKALAISRSGRVITYLGDWRHLRRIARALGGDHGQEVILQESGRGQAWLMVGPVDMMAPLADSV
jgi:hypothetical protein